jgi:hypothetical protein
MGWPKLDKAKLNRLHRLLGPLDKLDWARNSRLKLQEWALPRLVKRAVKRQHNKLCRHSNRVFLPYSRLNRLVAVLHNKA